MATAVNIHSFSAALHSAGAIVLRRRARLTTTRVFG
jgi:hypothetical protein